MSYGNWNSQKLFLVSITYNSKIRELSDGNRVIVCQTNLFVIGPTIFELWVMEIENWVTEIGKPNNPLFTLFGLIELNRIVLRGMKWWSWIFLEPHQCAVCLGQQGLKCLFGAIDFGPKGSNLIHCDFHVPTIRRWYYLFPLRVSCPSHEDGLHTLVSFACILYLTWGWTL